MDVVLKFRRLSSALNLRIMGNGIIVATICSLYTCAYQYDESGGKLYVNSIKNIQTNNIIILGYGTMG